MYMKMYKVIVHTCSLNIHVLFISGSIEHVEVFLLDKFHDWILYILKIEQFEMNYAKMKHLIYVPALVLHVKIKFYL